MTLSTNAASIINALKDSANDTLSAALGSTPLQAFAIGSNGNFPYNWQDTANVTLFNKLTYDWIESNLKAGASPLTQDASFTNQYIEVTSKISWGLSTSDQALLNQAANNATEEQAAVQNSWIEAFGSLPPAEPPIMPMDAIAALIMTWANPVTTLDEILNTDDLDYLLRFGPPQGKPVLPVFVNWLNAVSSSLSLQNSVFH